MRPRFLIVVVLIALLAVALLFWRRPVQRSGSAGPSEAAKHSISAPVARSNPINGNTPVVAPTPITNQPIVSDISKLEEFRRYVERHNKPVDFFGLVIDQDSNPIPGVTIKSGVSHWTMPIPSVRLVGSKDIQLETTTGPDGRFELTGATGDGFGVGLYKDGYEAESEKNGFRAAQYSYYNPVIFKMWSTNIHEKLITGKYAFDIVPDGRPYFINLTDGTISESGTGDLKVWIQYTNHVVPRRMWRWSAGIIPVNGGLLEEPIATPMYEAPKEGYVPEFQETGQLRGGQRGQIGQRQFYLRLKNGQEYGEMTIDLIAPFNPETPGLVSLSYAINPSGSRILR